MEQADYIAVKVNRLIAYNRSTALASASNTDTKQLWVYSNILIIWARISKPFPNQINNYFVNIATDPDYDRSAVIKEALRAPHHVTNFFRHSMDSIELIFARIRRTSPGIDNIPYQVYRDYAHELSEVVTILVNMSIGLGVVPSAWCTVVITPE